MLPKTRQMLREEMAREPRPPRLRRVVRIPVKQRLPGVEAIDISVPVSQLADRGIAATAPEALVYQYLEKQGVVFEFQSSLLGGRQLAGGAVADFVIVGRSPPLAIRVMGDYWHGDPEKILDDEQQKMRLIMAGYEVVDIWEEWINRNLNYVMSQALAGIEVGR